MWLCRTSPTGSLSEGRSSQGGTEGATVRVAAPGLAIMAHRRKNTFLQDEMSPADIVAACKEMEAGKQAPNGLLPPKAKPPSSKPIAKQVQRDVLLASAVTVTLQLW